MFRAVEVGFQRGACSGMFSGQGEGLGVVALFSSGPHCQKV